MRAISSIGLGLSVCAAVSALAVPARADDGAPVAADPAAIAASVEAAAPSPPEPQRPSAPQFSDTPETPLIPPVSAVVPPAIPPVVAAPTVSPQNSSTPSMQPDPAAAAAPVAARPPSVTPAGVPAGTSAAPVSDTGNTTQNNSRDITAPPAVTSSQTFVWNWYWNCATDTAIPAVAAPPAAATTIILNWHWACPEPPPPLDIAGITVCVSCNIAISVRVGSPGDSGELAQTIEAALRDAAAPVAASTPLVPPPVVPLPSVSAGAAPPPRGQLLDGGIVLPAVVHEPDTESPRHGAPAFFGAGPQRQARAQPKLGAVLLHARLLAPHPTSSVFPSAGAGRFAEPRRASSKAPRRARAQAGSHRGPAPPIVPPTVPALLVLAAGAAAAHGGGSGAVAAVASALLLPLLYAVYAALGVAPAVPPARRGGARPHPPG